MLIRSLLASLAAILPASLAQAQRPTEIKETDTLKLFERRSEKVSAFWGRDMSIRAGVVLPRDFSAKDRLPVSYSIHGFGGSHLSAQRREQQLLEGMDKGSLPRMVYVYLDARVSLGHHEFADSVNCGPWGTALVTEFIPALEEHFHAFAKPAGRFVTGHSSGGWSSLWLQVAYPDTFGGTWSTAPDPVDFREFTGIDIYTFANAYRDPDGAAINLMRRKGKWIATVQQFVRNELKRGHYGGQFMSFNAVFSPRGDDGQPMPLFDVETGEIDRSVAETWRKYDIVRKLHDEWPTLAPKLKGKLHVMVGTQDTFRLEEACYLLRDALQELGSDAVIEFAEGRDHGDLYRPHPELWPNGLMTRIHNEMQSSFERNQ